MDIKEKLKVLIDKQKQNIKISHVTSDPVKYDEFIGRTAIITQQNNRTILHEQILTPEAEQAVIDSLDPWYYNVGDIDVSEEELKKFPDISDIHVINGVRFRLRKQQSVVSRRVSNLILEKQMLCTEEMKKIAEMQRELCMAVTYCQKSRKSLKAGSNQFTAASLGILSNYSKRQKVHNVIESLRTIRTLQRTDIQLQTLLKDHDYPGAIQLLLECQKAAETFQYFKCVSDLTTKLQDTLEMTEEQLDCALSKIALNFSPTIYKKLFIAYGLFSKIQVMIDQLHMHLTSHIHNCAFNIVLGYVELCKGNLTGSDVSSTITFSKMQYSELCKHISEEYFLPCFLDLSKGMWNILKSYQDIRKWHTDSENQFADFQNKISDIDECERYIHQKFDHGVLRIWQDVQAKVKTFILSASIANFKFDDFLKVLDIINRLIDVGEAFCGSKSETLHDSIKKHSFNFFNTHHWSRMEELHMVLENEGWEICPVKPSFLAIHLVEYKFLREQKLSNGRLLSPMSSPFKGDKKGLFDSKDEGFNPFDVSVDEPTEEDIMISDLSSRSICEDDSDEDLPEELKGDFVEEHFDHQNTNVSKTKEFSNTPMVTNTILTILRLFGKYIRMMRLLQPIAFDVLLCFCQLYEFYFYAVFHIFSSRSVNDEFLSPRLKNTLKRIEDSLIISPEDENTLEKVQKLPEPFLGHEILDDSPDSLCSLAVRVTAVESLAFLASQLQTLQGEIEYLIPSRKRGFLHQFYTNTVNMTEEIRHVVYSYVASKIIDYDDLISRMGNVKWDISELMSQHSAYVDILLRQIQIFTMRLNEIKKVRPIPLESQNALWSSLISLVNRSLLEGYATTRKCSNEGRSLMQLDYQQFVMKLEGLTTVRPMPERSLVESYIKAYYLPEGALDEWILANRTNYSNKQLICLVNCMTHISKRIRQKVISNLEEFSKK